MTWVGINDLAYQAPVYAFVSNAESCYRSTIDPVAKLQRLFELQDQLYGRGARNFCYIDVPPMDRSPACGFTFPCYVCSRVEAANSVFSDDSPMLQGRGKRFVAWNETLTKCIRDFTAKHGLKDSASPSGTPDSEAPTCLYFSSYKVFSEILDNPGAECYPSEDVKKAGGSIWMDQLHATAAVHKGIAHELAKFLRSIEVTARSV